MPDSLCPALKVFVGDKWMTVEDASRTDPDVIREALTDAFAFVSLTPHTVARIQLGSRFRLSLQAERKNTPYRLQKIAEECQLGTAEKNSPEMKFFESGGIHALTALAVAGTDDKNVGLLLSKLPDAELHRVLHLVNSLQPHRDFQFMAEKVRRGKARSSQRSKQSRPLPGSRYPPKRKHPENKGQTGPAKKANRDNSKPLANEQLEGHTRQRLNGIPTVKSDTESGHRVRSRSTNRDFRQAHKPSRVSSSCETSADEPSVHGKGDERVPVEHTTSPGSPGQVTPCQCPSQRQVHAGSLPPIATPTENWPDGNYRIDLDTLLDGNNDLPGYYAIDLDNINLFASTL